MWYGATWINVPGTTELEFQFQSHPQTQLRWTLNGEPVAVPAAAYTPLAEGGSHCTQATKKVTLRAGWNQVAFRGYCVGYPPFRVGLVLDGAQEKLWDLQLAGVPPQEAALKPKP